MRLTERLSRYLGGLRPAAGLSERQTAGGLLVSIGEGAVYTVAVSLVGGQYLAGFALLLGAGPRGVAAAAALPALAGGVQVLAAPVLARRYRRVPVLSAGAALHRAGWGLAGFLVLILPGPLRFPVYVTLVFLAHAAQFATVPAWWSLISDLVDPGARGRYFGLRNAVLAGTGIAAVLAAGAVLDWFPGLPGFLLLHGAAALLGVLNVRLMLAHPEPRGGAEGEPAPALAPLGNRSFLLITGFVAAWTLGQTLALPLQSIVLLRVLSLPFGLVSWLMVTAAAATTLSLFAWGLVCDRVGEGRLISWLAPVAATVQLGWLYAESGRIWLLLLLFAAQGAATAGITLALGNINLALAGGGRERAAYLALFSAVTSVAAGLGPLAGGLIGHPAPAFRASGFTGWALWAVWWFWYRPHRLLTLARQARPGARPTH